MSGVQARRRNLRAAVPIVGKSNDLGDAVEEKGKSNWPVNGPFSSNKIVVPAGPYERPVSVLIVIFLVFFSWWFLGQEWQWELQSSPSQYSAPPAPGNIKITKNVITEVKRLLVGSRPTHLAITPTPMRDRLRKPKFKPRRKLTECGYLREDFWWAVYPDAETYFFHYPVDDRESRSYETDNTSLLDLVYRRMARQRLIWNRESKVTGLPVEQVHWVAMKLEQMRYAVDKRQDGKEVEELARNYSETEEWKGNVPRRLNNCGYSSLDFWWSWIDGDALGDAEFFAEKDSMVRSKNLVPKNWPGDVRELTDVLRETWHPERSGETGLTVLQHRRIWDMIKEACGKKLGQIPAEVGVLGEDPLA